MLTDDLQKVNPLLSDRARLSIMVLVSTGSSADELDFNTLLERLELTKGNLSSHLRKLEEGKLLKVTKSFVERKPRTTYACTAKGLKELKAYLAAIEKVLKQTARAGK